MLVISTFVLVLAATACHGRVVGTDDFNVKFERGINHLFTHGNVTVDLAETFPLVDFPSIFRDVIARDDPAACTPCQLLVDAFIDVVNTLPKRTVTNIVKQVCPLIGAIRDEICEALIDSHIDLLYYIIRNNPDLKSATACAVLLQSNGCVDEDLEEWSIPIQSGGRTQWKQDSGKQLNILHITDIHYDSGYTEGTSISCGDPVCCDTTFAATSEEDAAGRWSEYDHCNTPILLVDETLKHISNNHDIDYVYFTGDIISHKLWDTSPEKNSKDIDDILALFEKYFDVPVYNVMGNHEPHPLNEWSSSSVTDTTVSTKWLYDKASEAWTKDGKWLPESTKTTIQKGGYYTVSPKPGFRIIVLNNNIAYVQNLWILDGFEDMQEQLQWLEETLHEAEANGEVVHLLMHIPAGDSAVYLPWAKLFRTIIDRYSDTITGIFNGHTHNDQLNVFFSSEDSSKAINVAWNGGSLTTYTFKNPNYMVFKVDADSWEVLDHDEFTFDVKEANLTPDLPPAWFKLYSFNEAYGLERSSVEEVAWMVVRMTSDHSLLDQYNRFRSRGVDQSGCDDKCKKWLLCEMVTSVQNDNTKCEELTDLYDKSPSN